MGERLLPHGVARADHDGSQHGHETVDQRAKEGYVDVHTNTVEGVGSLMKRAVVGTYHRLPEKHLQFYADEVPFLFNNCENLYLFRNTLMALLLVGTLPYQALTN